MQRLVLPPATEVAGFRASILWQKKSNQMTFPSSYPSHLPFVFPMRLRQGNNFTQAVFTISWLGKNCEEITCGLSHARLGQLPMWARKGVEHNWWEKIMWRTISIELLMTSDQDTLLLDLEKSFSPNAIVPDVIEHRCWNRVALHAMTCNKLGEESLYVRQK